MINKDKVASTNHSNKILKHYIIQILLHLKLLRKLLEKRSKMAAASPMATQLRTSSFVTNRVLAAPKGLSGSSFKVIPGKRVSTFTVKAIQSEKVCVTFKLEFCNEFIFRLNF